MLFTLFRKIGLKFSLNDPRWGRNSEDDPPQPNNPNGRKPPDGPPDLDQLWRDFNQRLSRLFGNKGGGGGDGSNSGGFKPDMKGAGIGAGLVALVVFFLWLASGFFIIQEGQTGVVMTFGKYTQSTPAGFNWRWPYPIQSHEVVNVSQIRTVEVGYRSTAQNKQPNEALMLTDDENIIDIQFAVQYRLKDAAKWLFNNRSQEETVKQVAETAIREIVGKSRMDFVLYEGREKVALDVGQLMQQILDRYDIGVQILNVTMLAVQPPEQVQAAFDDAVKAGQDRDRQKNEGQAYANNVIPRARGAASRLQQESEGYRARIVATAEGDASRFEQILTEYQKAPSVMRERMYLDTMQQIFTNTSKVMIDAKSGSNLLYLPLDKLIAQTAAEVSNSRAGTGDPQGIGAAGVAGAAAESAMPQDVPPGVDATRSQNDARVRETRNSREREVR